MFNIENKDVNFLVGQKSIQEEILKPFDKNVCMLLSEFSLMLLKNKDAKKFSDLIFLSFWCRKKHLEKLKNEFKEEKIRVGKGVIFHITPSNVPNIDPVATADSSIVVTVVPSCITRYRPT